MRKNERRSTSMIKPKVYLMLEILAMFLAFTVLSNISIVAGAIAVIYAGVKSVSRYFKIIRRVRNTTVLNRYTKKAF